MPSSRQARAMRHRDLAAICYQELVEGKWHSELVFDPGRGLFVEEGAQPGLAFIAHA